MRPLACSLLLLLLALATATAPANAAQFKLQSPDIAPGSMIAKKFVFSGCGGQNISPALSWSGAPAGTKGFVLTLYDPDAPTGSGFWHWVMYDIPANVTSLPEGAGVPGKQPEGAMMARSDYGSPGYGGPCPPHGDTPHHYVFTLFAVNTDKLKVPADPTPAVVGFTTHFATIGRATFTARYGY